MSTGTGTNYKNKTYVTYNKKKTFNILYINSKTLL